MTETLTFTGELTITNCWCGIRMAVPESLYRWARKDPANHIYCPLGHTFVFQKTEADALRAKLDQAQADAQWHRRRAEEAAAATREADARTAAARSEVARTRQRVAGGACPCCNRSFVALHRHMATKHPDYVDAVDLPVEILTWSNEAAAAEVVRLAGEPMTPPQVLGRLVLAGRHRDTLRTVTNALYNAGHHGRIRRVAPKTWAAVDPAAVQS